MRRIPAALLAALLALPLVPACETGDGTVDNPFLADQAAEGKADSQYQNPDGLEVEVDLEADIDAPSYKLDEGPAVLGQFALTYLRKRGDVYLESLAEDASSEDRVEWRIDGAWKTAAQAASAPDSKKTHFRIRGINAVLLHSARTEAKEGNVLTAVVPTKPFSLMSDAGDKCAEPDDHMPLDSTIYWYLWDPDRTGCAAAVTTQEMTVTVSKVLPLGKVTYPEYDRLVADGKVTAVVLFGQIGEGSLESDSGMQAFKRMASWLKAAGYKEVAKPPVGRRFTKTFGTTAFEIDLYSPADFAGLSDMAHWSNFKRALGEHEIVAYDGHSMLGASDFWSRDDLTYLDGYQVFLYGGCLGYEYYVRPIVDKKGGWANVDILSAVVEVTADANEFAAPVLAKVAYALGHGNKVSWQDLLKAVRRSVGDSTFGVSGARENCYAPTGSLCGPGTGGTGDLKRYEDATATKIPDNRETGVVRAIDVPDDFVAKTVTLELDVDHTWVGDLRITLEHDGIEAVAWDNAGGSGQGLKQSVTLKGFAGKAAKGRWTLIVADTEAQDTGTLNRWALSFTL